jgi:hypothetical protein
VEDRELVVALAAIDRRGDADTVGQPATRNLNGREDVVGRNVRRGGIVVALRAEDLSDLDPVVPQAQVDRRAPITSSDTT